MGGAGLVTRICYCRLLGRALLLSPLRRKSSAPITRVCVCVASKVRFCIFNFVTLFTYLWSFVRENARPHV